MYFKSKFFYFFKNQLFYNKKNILAITSKYFKKLIKLFIYIY